MPPKNQKKYSNQYNQKLPKPKDCIVLVDRKEKTKHFPLTRKAADSLRQKGLYQAIGRRGRGKTSFLLDNFGRRKPRVVLELIETLQESIDRRRIGISPSSVYAYIRAIELFSINVPLPESIKAVDYDRLNLYRDYIEEEVKKDIGNGSQLQRLRTYYNHLVTILQQAREGKNLPILRIPSLRLPTIELSPREPYSPYVCDQIYAAAYSDVQQIRSNFLYFQNLQTDHLVDYVTNRSGFIGIMKALLEYKEELYDKGLVDRPSYGGNYPCAVSSKEYSKFKSRLQKSKYGLTPKEFAQKYDNKENEAFVNSKQLITQRTSDKSLSVLKFYCQRLLPSFFSLAGENSWNFFQRYSSPVIKDMEANPDVFPLSSKNTDSILELFVPTIQTFIPFFILTLQTGVNPESIRSMRRVHRIGKEYILWNDRYFKRPGKKLMVRMKKERGQRRGDRKFFEREISGATKPNLVEILEFYSEYSAALAKIKPENTEVEFWLYVSECKIKSITEKNIYKPLAEFFDRHEILDEQGNRIRNFSPSRMRPSFVLQELLDGRTPAQIRSNLGHYNEKTLDHYIKNDRVDKVLTFKLHQGMQKNLDRAKQFKANKATGDTKADLKLIEGAVPKEFAYCTDETNPTIDNPRFDSSGKCQSHLGCFGCERAVVTKEILPFVCARLLEMDKYKNIMQQDEWEISFGEDYYLGLEGLAQFSKKDQNSAWLKANSGELKVTPLRIAGRR